jgi:hypothetical protein
MFESKGAVVAEIIDDPVAVELSPDGDPATFIWHKFEYVVAGQPQVVFTRTPWWETERLPERIDTERWTLDAARAGDEVRRYQLAHDGGEWRLVADLG